MGAVFGITGATAVAVTACYITLSSLIACDWIIATLSGLFLTKTEWSDLSVAPGVPQKGLDTH